MNAAVLALATAFAPIAAEPCNAQDGCITAGAAQVFALADQLYAAGDLAGAEAALGAITQDKHVELRAEAWFRIAAVREKRGDLGGAAAALRQVIAEQPQAPRARLELARLLSLMGQKDAARAELAGAQQIGLPAEVAATVRQFSTSLAPPRRRGLSVELASGADSNINRATTSPFVDTIIAPFTLDPESRRQSGIGFSASVQGWSQNRLASLDLMSRATLRADLFAKSRFNDIQLSADSGPQWQGRWGRVHPALLVERRWYGGTGYAFGYGGQLGWQAALSQRLGAELGLSFVHQSIDRNRFQDGWRTNANVSLSRRWGAATTVRGTVRYGALDARAEAESLDQFGADALVASRLGAVTLFGEAGYTLTRGRAPIFLFGRRREDRRFDLSAGALFPRWAVGGFAPLVRLSRTNSKADIQLYDYRRTRLDLGVSRSF